MQLMMSKIDRPIKYLLLLSIKQIVTPLLLHDTLQPWNTILLDKHSKTFEPVHEKTNNLHKRKQSRRSASR